MKPATSQHTPTCIEWRGAHDDDGYGRVQDGKKWRGAHRVEWEKKNGPIATGLVIDHICRTRNCVNVDHMELVTPKENTMRGINPMAINARKIKCAKGHELSGENLALDYRGHRQCRECGRGRWRAYRNRKIAEGTWTRS